MDFLTDEQNERFATINARLGLGPTEFTAQLPVGKFVALPSVRTMSSTKHSDFPVQYIGIGSVEEMRTMVGVANEIVISHTGSEPDYPVAPSQAEIERILHAIGSGMNPQISPELMERIKQALLVYVVGDPARVTAFVPLINATQFPGRAAVFTGDILEVPAGTTHEITGEDPVVLNYGKIIVGPGASIKVRTATFINSQICLQEQGAGAAAAADPYTYQYVADAMVPPVAQQGGTGPTGDPQTKTGTDGSSSYNTGTCKYDCKVEPGNGPQGNDGKKGQTGATGMKGHPSPGGIHNVGAISGPITILIAAGDGQKGGKGGTGGAGSPGGAKGKAATGCANQPTDGKQGRGGQGGDGGPGGDGGDGPLITIYYTYNGGGDPPIKVTVRNGNPGGGGEPGDPGAGTGNLGQGGIGKPPGNPGPNPKFALNRQ
jgi:hypothetical protein